MNLQPGTERQIDAKISEVLFGVKAEWRHWFYGATRHYDMMDANLEIIPQYSTTWNGMQLVVVEMRRRNWQLVLNDDLDKWTAIYFWDPNGESYEAKSESAPHAVCMAALSALGNLEGQADD